MESAFNKWDWFQAGCGVAKAQVWETAGHGASCVTLDKLLTLSEHLENRLTIPTCRVVVTGWVLGVRLGRASAWYMLA